jgi:uroporphyrinogen-III synthase
MAKSTQILSTKKLTSEQKQALIKANLEVLEVDFIQTQNKSFELKDLNENLIFTSQNAVHSILSDPKSEELKSKNVFCVGLKTKE